MLAHLVLAVDAGGVIGLALFLAIPLLYLVACWWIAKYAERKGQNFAVFFLIGLLFSPIFSGIAALVVRDPRRHEPATGGDGPPDGA